MALTCARTSSFEKAGAPCSLFYPSGSIKEARNQGRLDYFFFEAALLLEDHYEEVCDELWYIYASEDERRMRLKRDRGYTDEKIDQIFASQMPEKAFRQACAHVIDSSGSMEGTQAQVRQILG